MTTNMTQKEEHRRIYEEKMNEALNGKGVNTTYLNEDEYVIIRDTVASWSSLSTAEKKELGTKGYHWSKRYAVVGAGVDAVLIFSDSVGTTNPDPAGDPGGISPAAAEAVEDAGLDTAKVVSHEGRMFNDLYSVHVGGGHCKARTFEYRLKVKFGKSIPRFAVACCHHCLHDAQHGCKPFDTTGATIL